jgi:hypothetical protein
VLLLTAWLRRPDSDNSWLSFTARSPRARSSTATTSAPCTSTNPVQHQQTKHVEIDLHFVRDRVAIGDVRVLHVSITFQFADIFTKGLPSSTFSEFRSSLNVASGYLWLWGALCVSFFFCWPVLYTAAPVVQTVGGGGG